MSGQLFVVSAPSGAGKTSLLKALVDIKPELKLSVSHCTRPMRPGEQQGRDYHFVSKPQFQKMIDEDDFLEYAEVFGNYYGTSGTWVRQQLELGANVILEIDWQGARQVRRKFADAISVFILPPSRAALETRLRARGQDAESVIQKRMSAAKEEMSHYSDADIHLINDDFDEALQQLKAVTEGSMPRLPESQLHALMEDLLA